jgi:hypothetical protein
LFRIRVALPAGASTSGPRGFEVNVRSTVWRSKTPSDSLGLVSTRLLSWGFQRTPLHRHEPATSTPTLALFRFPGPVWAFRPAFAKRLVTFRLCGFSPPGRFTPSLILRVYCTPLPILGFIVFRLSLLPPCGVGSSVPSTMRHPSKLFPLQQPSLSGFLPSYRWPSKDGLVSGFFSAGESVAIHTCCHA